MPLTKTILNQYVQGVLSLQYHGTGTESFASLARASLGVVRLNRMASDSLSKLYNKYWLDNSTLT